MDPAIRATLDSLIHQGGALLSSKSRVDVGGTDPLNIAFQTAAPHVVGNLVTGIFGVPMAGTIARTITSASIRQQKVQQRVAVAQQYADSCDQYMASVEATLSQLSVLRGNVPQGGNSQILVQRLAKAKEAIRPETRVGRTLSVLKGLQQMPLVFTRDLPARALKLPEEGTYEALRSLERDLRGLIAKCLSQGSSDWWQQRIPAQVRRRAESRMARAQHLWPWHLPDEADPVHYLDFSDYAGMIGDEDSWREAFSRIFGNREIIIGKLRELEPIRNSIAHSRKISSSDAQKLRIYSAEIRKAFE